MKKLIKNLIADLSHQIWTLVGLFSAWLVLTGSAKQVVGYAILVAIVLWILTYSIRHPRD